MTAISRTLMSMPWKSTPANTSHNRFSTTLTAQAVTTDYDQNYFRRAGIDIGETIRLDANDPVHEPGRPGGHRLRRIRGAGIPAADQHDKFKVFEKSRRSA